MQIEGFKKRTKKKRILQNLNRLKAILIFMIIKGICGLISPPLPSGSIALALRIYLLL